MLATAMGFKHILRLRHQTFALSMGQTLTAFKIAPKRKTLCCDSLTADQIAV
jgi:hypothetical protein